MAYKPETFSEIVSDAADALMRGIKDGIKQAEVEFPAIASADCAHPPVQCATQLQQHVALYKLIHLNQPSWLCG